MITALEGIRVVELADHVFVPSAGGILADWGADVIKVEHHEHGDLVRGFSSGPGVAGDVNLLYENSNRGKRSIALNITEDEGRDHPLRADREGRCLLDQQAAERAQEASRRRR